MPPKKRNVVNLNNLKLIKSGISEHRGQTVNATKKASSCREAKKRKSSNFKSNMIIAKYKKAESQIRELRALVNEKAPEISVPKKKPVQHKKPLKDCSRSEKSRRLREVKQLLKNVGASTSDLNVPVDANIGAKIKSETKMTERQFKKIRKETNALPSLHAVKKEKANACREYGDVKIVKIKSKDGKLIDVRTYDMKKALLARIEWTNGEIPDEITVLITGDCGGDSTKIGLILPDFPIPQSVNNYSILAHYFGSDKREYINQFLPDLLKCIPQLREGIQTSKGFKKFKFVFVADFLFGYQFYGLQGASSTYYSPFCLATKTSPDCREFRTIDSIKADAKKLQKLVSQRSTKEAIATAKQQCHSVFDVPVSDNIPLEDYCPPVEHTLAGSLNLIIKKKLTIKQRDVLFKKAKVAIKFPAQELTGGDGRKLLTYLENVRYKGPGCRLFMTLKKVEQYAVARDLAPREIVALDDAIKEFAKAVKSGKLTQTIKVHAILRHVMPFVKKWGSWGKYSEQAGEGIHKTCKAIEEKCRGSAGDKQAKASQMFCEEQILANKVLG